MRPVAVITVFIALASSVGLSACSKPAGMGPPPAQGTPSVGVITVESQSVTINTELPGRTAPVLIAEVRPQVTGLVRSRNFVEGSEVQAGQVLYEIDPATYRATTDNAEAALAKARANLQSIRLKAQRYQELVAINAVSQQDNDDAAASQQQAEADVASALASVETARINLAYTRVTAPISGRIGKSSVTAGALVTASQTTALATVQKLDPIYVDVTQSSTAVLRLRRALAQGELKETADDVRVGLLLEDGTRYPLEGKLQFSDVTVDPNTGAITLRAEFPNPKRELLPGMYVRAVVEEGSKHDVLLVPQQAVTRDASGKPLAYVVTADSKLEQRSLQVERAIADRWLVNSGLKAGDRLVVEGLQNAHPGAVVRAVPYTAPSTALTSPTSWPVAKN